MTTARPLTRCHLGKVLPLDPSIAGRDGCVALKYGTSQATRLIRNAVNRAWYGVLAHCCTTHQLERVKLWGSGSSIVSHRNYIHRECCWQSRACSGCALPQEAMTSRASCKPDAINISLADTASIHISLADIASMFSA